MLFYISILQYHSYKIKNYLITMEHILL